MYRIGSIIINSIKAIEESSDERYHIEVTDSEDNRVYCTGYILAEVQNNVFQYFQFSVDLIQEDATSISQEELLKDAKLKSIINAICGILFNNYIGT